MYFSRFYFREVICLECGKIHNDVVVNEYKTSLRNLYTFVSYGRDLYHQQLHFRSTFHPTSKNKPEQQLCIRKVAAIDK